MDVKGYLNWIGSAVLWAVGTTLTGITLVPGMDWKTLGGIASTTFASSMIQHLREHPFQSPTPGK